MRKKKIKLVIHLLFVIGISLVSFPVIKNTVTLMKLQLARIEISSELPLQESDEVIYLPTLESYLAASSDNIGPAIGEIVIPSQKIHVPIFAGLNNEQMLFGAGMMYPERKPKSENLLLFGHHLGMAEVLLGNVKNLEVNDLIHVRYLSESLYYQVVENKIVMETDLSVLENTDHPQLTVITCDQPTLTDKRVVITARLLEEKQEKRVEYVNETQDVKIIRKSIVKYSVVPILIILLFLIIGNYALWQYV